MIELSLRLAEIAHYVPKGSRLADIGSDHALLPVFLVQQDIVTRAVAGELNPGPFAAAQKQVAAAGLEGKIDVRRGDGLSVVEPQEVDVVTIAGMGGALIVQILSTGATRLDGVRRLVLQPNVGEPLVRSWLLANGWQLKAESLVEEDGKWYEVLTADWAADPADNGDELYREREIRGVFFSRSRLLEFGPYLVERGGATFCARWASELRKLETIVRRMGQSQLPEAIAKRTEMEKDMAFIREVLACSRTDNRSSD